MPAYRSTVREPNSSPETTQNERNHVGSQDILEGAVGYQQVPPVVSNLRDNVSATIYSRLPLSNLMNLDEHTFQDSENNNVDENSNDHQYNEFANYHHQFHDQSFLFDNDSHDQRAAQEQAARERVYQRLQQPIDQPDRTPSNITENLLPGLPYQGSSHRRNFSEDLSLNTNSLPPLPSRNSNINNFYHSGQNLPWLPALPLRRANRPSQEEIQNEAEALLYNFTIEQFQSQNVDLSPLQPYNSLSCRNQTWYRAGQDLRMLADAFSKSNEREIVRRKAYDINMSSITMNNFFQLCSELFEGDGGITQERIVVLFTFISDVAIQHVRIKAEQFIQRLMTWSLKFIFERICEWVQRAGGWGVVLSNGASFLLKCTTTVLASLGIVALGVYILKTIREL